MVFNKKEYDKLYRIKNKEKIDEYYRQYHSNIKNKEKRKERDKIPENKKSKTISQWKQYKVKEDNWDLVYDIYMNTDRCDICDVELI